MYCLRWSSGQLLIPVDRMWSRLRYPVSRKVFPSSPMILVSNAVHGLENPSTVRPASSKNQGNPEQPSNSCDWCARMNALMSTRSLHRSKQNIVRFLKSIRPRLGDERVPNLVNGDPKNLPSIIRQYIRAVHPDKWPNVSSAPKCCMASAKSLTQILSDDLRASSGRKTSPDIPSGILPSEGGWPAALVAGVYGYELVCSMLYEPLSKIGVISELRTCLGAKTSIFTLFGGFSGMLYGACDAPSFVRTGAASVDHANFLKHPYGRRILAAVDTFQ